MRPLLVDSFVTRLEMSLSNVLTHHLVHPAVALRRALGLSLLLALGLLMLLSNGAAATSREDLAKQTAGDDVARASNRLAGASPGRPQLVHDEQGKPGYYVVPAHKHGRVVGLVGVSLSGREWQWYSDGYKEQKFPVISQGEAERALGGPAVLTAAPDKHMYWGRSGRLLSAERPGKVVAAASVISTGAGAAAADVPPDVRLGAGASAESRDPSGATAPTSTQTQAQAQALPISKTLTMPPLLPD